jgi:bifunctional DNA-binding transcriptional regulator/antitoxin component of YhaV-PrlF toxin-antitoxin module
MGVMGVKQRHEDEATEEVAVGLGEVGRGGRSAKDAARGARKVRVRNLGATGVKVHAFLTVQRRGTVALPPELRRRYRLDEPGAQVEITEREDGVLELRPLVAVPATEAWFWDERWQAGEREVAAHVAAGEVTEHASGEDFLAHLDALDAEG